ncbi:penicillin-binding protein 1A [Thiohalobacter sp. COW1]|nr:penicillin-binding protein 1A [Thiohalobacter sp. COW1]
MAGLVLAAGLYFYITPQLPSVEALRDVQFQVPLRIYSADDQLIAEYGEKRRIPVTYEQLPQPLIQAFLAAEDDRFFKHPGVDYQGLLRAAFELLRTGEKRQGGSTITMQVARNFFLSSEKTYLRKLTEIFLALKIERELSKQQILELYLNKIYLGQRAYGVGAAAQIYYGVPLEELSLAQMAMIAGLPKAPSRDNPVSNPLRAEQRRTYVLGRMYTLGHIDAEQYRQALTAPISARVHARSSELEAAYVAEMVRAHMVERYGEGAYTEGYQVRTTLDSRRQRAASRALRAALMEYDQRHGYRGAEGRVSLPETAPAEAAHEALDDFGTLAGLAPAVVLALEEQAFTALLADGREVTVAWDGIEWARPYLSHDRRGKAPTAAADVVQPGDIVRLQEAGAGWRLAQLPAVEGALVSLRPDDGAILALVGGLDYFRSKFNRAVQARRQPGSSFKPFIYSAALDKGFTAATIINDAPVVFDDPGLEAHWRPENYSGRFYGPTRLREALTHSRNLVSIRLLQDIGVRYAIDFVKRYGFEADQLPANLSLALGSGSVTPLQMARGYAVFANGGYRIEPYFIERILDADGGTVYQARPPTVCRDCAAGDGVEDAAEAGPAPEGIDAVLVGPPEPPPPPRAERVLEPRNSWLMNSLLQDVVKRGTGRRALQLGRGDLRGKTGTTNDQRDAWFCGFVPGLVSIAWVGFDELEPLGRGETGGRAALPMWIDYMRSALEGIPEQRRDPPSGLVTVRIDPVTGLLAPSGRDGAIFETFRQEQVPTRYSRQDAVSEDGGDPQAETVEPLF